MSSKISSSFNVEASMKFFVLSAFTSGVLLYWFSNIYLVTGCTTFSLINNFESVNTTSLFSYFVLCAFLFKLGAAPLHLWVTHIYSGVKTLYNLLLKLIPLLLKLILLLLMLIPLLFKLILLLCSMDDLQYALFTCTPLYKKKRDYEAESKKYQLNNSVHDPFIISLFVGILLGDAHAQKRFTAIRISFSQSVIHESYLMHIWSILSTRGYCSRTLPTTITHKDKQTGRIYYSLRITTYSFSSLNWLYDLFYHNKVKVIPENIINYLTPIALAYWIMDDGSKRKTGGLVLCTQGFTRNEVQKLSEALFTKFNILSNPALKKGKTGNQLWYLYIRKKYILHLQLLVSPYIIPSMFYKIGLSNPHLA
jgi:ubiquinol-cytochrome c reductase cytochrome b subunit